VAVLLLSVDEHLRVLLGRREVELAAVEVDVDVAVGQRRIGKVTSASSLRPSDVIFLWMR
jgi:hypothetical protein